MIYFDCILIFTKTYYDLDRFLIRVYNLTLTKKDNELSLFYKRQVEKKNDKILNSLLILIRFLTS